MNSQINKPVFHFNQLTVSATDNAANPKTGMSIVIIEVIRNLHTPVFEAIQYMANASENDPVGKFITAVSAYDEDVDINKNRYVSILNQNDDSRLNDFVK